MANSLAHNLPGFWSNLLFVRHGESTCNEANRFAGTVDAPLTQLGRAQARQASKTFFRLTPDRLFVSNLSRARETAKILFPESDAGLTHEVDHRLAERHLGEFTLRNKAELQAIHGIRGYDDALYDPNGTIRGAESYSNFKRRVEQFLFETVVPLLRSGKRVLVVAHKYVVELMVRLILELPREDGYDLRLPNSKVLCAIDAAQYCRKESRTRNRIREWVVLHHGEVLAGAGLVGLGASGVIGPLHIPWQPGFVLLILATIISLLRVEIGQAVQPKRSDWELSLSRFALLPMLCGLLTFVTDAPVWWMVVALVLATPAALTSVTLSRCAGGMVHPAVGTMLRSTLIGNTTVLILVGGWFDWNVAIPIVLMSFGAIGVPCALTLWIRKIKPITAANFSERQAVWPIILLAAFVGMSCAELSLSDLYMTGTLAVVFSLVLRLLSATLTRWSSCVAPDDYLSLGFPNLFLLVVLGQILGLPELTSFATWLLVPMFLLSPLDVWLCRRFAAKGADDRSLRRYLCLGAPDPIVESYPRTAENLSAPPHGINNRSRTMIEVRTFLTVLAVIGLFTVVANADEPAPTPVLMTKHPMSPDKAKAKQEAWAKHHGFDVVMENSIGMQLHVVPPGTYLMGSPRGEVDRKGQENQVEVTLSKVFLIGRYEVTQGEWEKVMGPIKRKRQVGSGDRFPMYEVNYAEASEFCRKMTALERETGELPDGYEYRLPTDAEWEYACRAGTLTATYFGDKVSSKLANYDGEKHPYNEAEKGPNLGRTAEVGSYPANAWGLHDMHGNLCEWCVDWYEAEVKGGVDPVQLDVKPKRVIRDCRFGNPGKYCRSANRYYAPPDQRRSTVGFRAALSKVQYDQ